MKHRQEITKEQAKRLKDLFGLTPGDSFSNPAPSDLCAEYRMETGYWLPEGKSRLVHAITTKDDDGNFINQFKLEVDDNALGIDADEYDCVTSEELKKAQSVLSILNQELELELSLEEVKSCADCEKLFFKKDLNNDAEAGEWVCSNCLGENKTGYCSMSCRRTGNCDGSC